MNHIHSIALAAALTITAAAQAMPVVAGSVSREAASSVFVDNVTGREWMGAEVTKYYSYAQTVAALGQGGQFAGYAIASYDDVAQLARNFGGPGAIGCSSGDQNNGSCSGNVAATASQVFGDSYEAAYSGTSYYYNYGYDNHYDYNYDDGDGSGYGYGYQTFTYSGNDDYGWFLTNANGANDEQPMAGIFNLSSYQDYSGSSSTLWVGQSWSTSASTDSYAGSSTGIGWMLFRDTLRADVPEPGSLALVALAIAGVAVTRRRRAVVGG